MAKPAPTEPERRRLKLSQLKDYPLQAVTYAPSSADEDERLKEVLRTGHYDPLHVMPPKNKAGLPPYTKLDGHRRARLLAELGEDEAEVVIRHDLVDVDRAAVDMVFYDFALGRRNSHPLDLARMIIRKYEIEKRRPQGGLKLCDEAEARDRVGKVIGMSGRNLQRYFRLLLTPVEVQNAVRDGHLPLVIGERVEALSKEQQAEIAKRIANGEEPKAVVRGYFQSGNGRHRKASNALSCFIKNLERALVDLEGRDDKIYCLTLREHTPVLTRARKLITNLISGGRKKPGNMAALVRRLENRESEAQLDDGAQVHPAGHDDQQ